MYTRVLVGALLAAALIAIIFIPWRSASEEPQLEEPPSTVKALTEEQQREILTVQVRQYLESKSSPLASDAEFVTGLKHWKLLIAISAIESQYCKRQLSYNCWGIGGDSAYRHYSSFQAAAQDANDLIERWQQKGRWLTVEDMNCHYVVPCNENWVNVVRKVLHELEALGTTTPVAPATNP